MLATGIAVEVRAKRLHLLSYLLAGACRSALGQHPSRHVGQSRPTNRVGRRAAAHHQAGRHDRQARLLYKQDVQPVRQPVTARNRRRICRGR